MSPAIGDRITERREPDQADSLLCQLWEQSLTVGNLNSLVCHAAEQYLGAQDQRGKLRLCVRTLETPEGNPKANNLAEREECIMQLNHALEGGLVSALRWPQWLGASPKGPLFWPGPKSSAMLKGRKD
eukprot:6471727-Amphidinium_carterae.2